MIRLRASVALVAAAAIVLAGVADAAPRRKGMARGAARAAVPAGPVVLPDVALPPPFPASPTARKKTELTELTAKRSGYDYEASQLKLLTAYDTPTDKRYAYAVHHNFRVVEAPRFQRYIGRIVDRLMACWPGPPPPIRVLITGNSSLSAYANDGGLIRISAGVLNDAETADSLAFILAHEIAHVLYEHQAKREALQRAIRQGVGILSSATILARETQFTSVGGKFEIGARKQFGSTGFLLSGAALQRFSDDAIIPFREAAQEFEADRLAFDLVVCARFDHDAGKQGVLVLGKAERPNLIALKFVADLGARYIASVLVKSKKNDLGSQLLQLGATIVIGKAMDKVVDAIAGEIEKSLGGEKRAKKLTEYLEKTYQPAPDVLAPSDQSLVQLKGDVYWTSLYRIIGAVTAINDQLQIAQVAAGAGRPVEQNPGLATALAVVAQPDPRVPESFEMAALMRNVGGDKPLARQSLERGSRLHWGYRNLLVDAGQAQFDAGDASGLLATTALARERLGNVPEILPLDVRVAVLAKDSAGAEKLAAQCLSKGGDTLYARCVEPMRYDPACSPRTEEGKAAMQTARLGRSTNALLNLPGIAMTLGVPPPELLKCMAGTAVDAKDLGVE